jgi:membrane fusion protein (multidrug efflux system)
MSAWRRYRVENLLIALALPLAACGPKPAATAPAAPPPAEVGVVKAEPASVGLVTELPGRVEASRVAQVRARVTGIVQKREFREGSDVKAGQVLFRSMPRPTRPPWTAPRPRWPRRRPTPCSHRAGRRASSRCARPTRSASRTTSTPRPRRRRPRPTCGSCRRGIAQRRSSTLATPRSRRRSPAASAARWSPKGALVSQAEATQLALIQQIDPCTSTPRRRWPRWTACAPPRPRQGRCRSAPVRIVLDDGSELPQRGRLLFSDLSVDPTSARSRCAPRLPTRRRACCRACTCARAWCRADQGAMLLPQQAVTRGPQGDTVLVVGEGGKPAPRPVKIGGSAGLAVDRARRPEAWRAGHRRRLPEDAPGAPVKPVPCRQRRPCGRPASAASRRTFRARLGGQPLRPRTMAKFFIDRPIFAWVIALLCWWAAWYPSRSCRWRSTPRWRRLPSSSPRPTRARRQRRWKTAC